MLQDGAWLRHASHANEMAGYLESRLRGIPQVRQLFPRQANAVFVDLPRDTIHALWDRGWMFYTFVGKTGCRLMCAWDTTKQDVDQFISDIEALLGSR